MDGERIIFQAESLEEIQYMFLKHPYAQFLPMYVGKNYYK